jgi:hypothetical protein
LGQLQVCAPALFETLDRRTMLWWRRERQKLDIHPMRLPTDLDAHANLQQLSSN